MIKDRTGAELNRGNRRCKENKDTGDVRYWQSDKTKDAPKDKEKR